MLPPKPVADVTMMSKSYIEPLLLIAVFLLPGLGMHAAHANEPALNKSCAGIRDDAKRLRCYDQANAAASGQPETAYSGVGIWADRFEKDADRETFTLTARKPNYFMYSYLTSPNQAPYEFTGAADRLDNSEIKFQLSFQTKLADNMFGKQADLWFGYTQVAYWQLFNGEISAPFRETNYEPEVYASFSTDYKIFGLNGRAINFGVVHQSNGRAEPLSRSWNRIYAEFQFERDNFAFTFKPWYRIKEDAADDDNPDITDYLGNYELHAYYYWDGQIFSAMARNVFNSDHRYNSELQWSFPIVRRLRGLVQWYNGYGENMIDYNHNNHRISIGILLTDWL